VAKVPVRDFVALVKAWEDEKAEVRGDYIVNDLERFTIEGRPFIITDTALGISSQSASVRIDLKDAEIHMAEPGQLLPTGATSIQGEQFENHFWAKLPGKHFLIGKKKK